MLIDNEWIYPLARKTEHGYFDKETGEHLNNKHIYNVQDETH
jgi:hypothetical protein